MKNFNPRLLLGIGLLIQSGTRLLARFVTIPSALQYALMLSALVLIAWGTFMFARSPEMKNSRLGRWKLRLIGRASK